MLLVIKPPQLAYCYSSKAKHCSGWISCCRFLWGMFRHGKGGTGPASIHSLRLSIFYKSQYCLRGKEHARKKYSKVTMELQSVTTKYFQVTFYVRYMKELALNILNWKSLGSTHNKRNDGGKIWFEYELDFQSAHPSVVGLAFASRALVFALTVTHSTKKATAARTRRSIKLNTCPTLCRIRTL